MKKQIRNILGLILFLCIASGCSKEETTYNSNQDTTSINNKISGSLGENHTYELENGVLTIKSISSSYAINYYEENMPFDEYNDVIKEVNFIGCIETRDYMFDNYLNLEIVKSDSNLNYIGAHTFENCTSLKNVEFDSLKNIRDYAFAGCTSLSDFTITSTLEIINQSAFLYSSIQNFNIMNNDNFSWINNVLIDNNVSDTRKCIALYVNPFESEITFPSNVGIISASMFENNKIIEKVDLKNVSYIGDDAFSNSTLKTIIGGTKVNNIGTNTFLNTPWINNVDSDYISIGNVLLSFKSSDERIVISEGITRICDNCFNSNKIKEIILPSTIDTIGAGAFTNCNNLELILFTSTKAPILDGKIANSNVKFYVKAGSINYFKNSLYFTDYKNQIEVKKINIEFLDFEGASLGSTIEEYGSTFDNFINAPKISGKSFLGWENQFGEIINIYSYIENYDNLILKPIYK